LIFRRHDSARFRPIAAWQDAAEDALAKLVDPVQDRFVFRPVGFGLRPGGAGNA